MSESKPHDDARARALMLSASVAMALLAVLSAAVRGLGALDADRAVLRFVSDGPGWLVALSQHCGSLALPAVAASSIAAVVAGAVVPRARRAALFVLSTVPVVMVLKWFLKLYATRSGPSRGSFDEFPSGHAAGTLALALVVRLLVPASWRATVRALLLGLALLVGFGLVVGRVHYATDILGGWLLTLAWVPLVWLVLMRDRERGGTMASCRLLLSGLARAISPVAADDPQSRGTRTR